jgi:hypothetical protein
MHDYHALILTTCCSMGMAGMPSSIDVLNLCPLSCMMVMLIIHTCWVMLLGLLYPLLFQGYYVFQKSYCWVWHTHSICIYVDALTPATCCSMGMACMPSCTDVLWIFARMSSCSTCWMHDKHMLYAYWVYIYYKLNAWHMLSPWLTCWTDVYTQSKCKLSA